MSDWTWVLLGLCVAGLLLPIVPAILVLRGVMRVRSRTNALKNSRLFTSLEALQLQSVRLQHVAAEAAPLAKRAQTAIETIRSSSAASGTAQARASLQYAGAEITGLLEDLR